MATKTKPEPVAQEVVRVRCSCEEFVLLVKLPDVAVLVVDAAEVAPVGPCPECRKLRSKNLDPGRWCWRCRGTQVVGEALPEPSIALSEWGRARVYAGKRSKGESVHRLHLHDLGEMAA